MMQEWLKTVDFDENGFVDFYDWRKLIEEHKRLDQMFQVVEQLMFTSLNQISSEQNFSIFKFCTKFELSKN